MTDCTAVWLSSLGRRKSVPCMAAITSVLNCMTAEAGSRFFGRFFRLASQLDQFKMIGMSMRTLTTFPVSFQLFFVTFTTKIVRRHYEFFVILSMTFITTDYVFSAGWCSVFTLFPLCNNPGTFYRVTGYTLFICEFSFNSTARMKGIAVVIVRWIVPSYHWQEIVKMSILSLSRKKFFRTGIEA